MKFALVPIAAAFITLWTPITASAEFFEIEALIGPAPSYSGEPLVVDFDLGQEFSEIRNVLVVIEATTTPLTFQSCGRMFDPQPCELEVHHPGFFIRLEDPTGFSTSTLVDRFRSDDPRQRSGVFDRRFLEFSFDHLRDGRGTLTVHWNSPAFIPEQIVLDFTFPTGEIVGAKLIVEGTPVPEPSLLAQLLIGTFTLSELSRRRRSK